MKHVIIIGGTGFLGYYSAKEFLLRGYRVSSLNLPDLQVGDWFPEQIEITHGDVFSMTVEELEDTFKEYDFMVYAVGPDDRVMPRAPSYKYFKEKLVDTTIRVFDAARKAGIKRSILLNSYFVHFHDTHPHLKLGTRHNYIRARVEQSEAVLGTGKGEMDVVVLGIPYVFGTIPGRVPFWREVLLDRLLRFNPVFYPSGGSSMIAVENVAEAVAGAIEYGEDGRYYPVGDVNMSWKEMFSIMFKAVGIKRRIVILPLWIARVVGIYMQIKARLNGHDPGLNLRRVFQDIVGRKFYMDPEESVEILQYKRGGIVESIEKTARACFPD